MNCSKCGSPLNADDVSIYKKMVARDAKTFLCRKCLAEHFGCTVAAIQEKIDFFKKSGCTLFCGNK